MRALRVLLRKEFLQLFRDKFMLRQMMTMPVVQLLILSSAATFEIKSAQTYIVDLDHSQTSRALVDRLQAGGRFVIAGASPSMGLANEAMLARDVGLIVGIPPNFERNLVRTRTASVQLVLNAEDGAAAGVTQAYAAQIIRAYAMELGAELTPTVATGGTLELSTRGWYNQDLNYRDFMVPGILVQLVTVIGTLLTAMNIVREKEIGTFDQLSVTPLSQGAFIAAKLIPLWIIALFELTIGLLIARFVFDVPMVGSIPLVFLAACVYLVAALGIGLWVSTLVETQQQAMFVTFFIVMTYLLMSGMFTPIRAMPEWAQWLTELNPVKHFIQLIRAVMLKGATIGDVLRPLGVLALFGAIVLTLAVRRYARR